MYSNLDCGGPDVELYQCLSQYCICKLGSHFPPKRHLLVSSWASLSTTSRNGTEKSSMQVPLNRLRPFIREFLYHRCLACGWNEHVPLAPWTPYPLKVVKTQEGYTEGRTSMRPRTGSSLDLF